MPKRSPAFAVLGLASHAEVIGKPGLVAHVETELAALLKSRGL